MLVDHGRFETYFLIARLILEIMRLFELLGKIITNNRKHNNAGEHGSETVG